MSGSGVALSREQLVQLIQQYRAHRQLWDVRDVRYFRRGQRARAWRALAARFCAPVPDLKRKIVSLMGSYRREKSREKQSLASGLGPEAAYKSKWFGYEHFSFMADRSAPPAAADPLDPAGIKVELEESEEEEAAEPAMEVEFSEPEEGRWRTRAPRAAPEACCSRDSYCTFGQYVSNELRKYDAVTLAHAKRAIAHLLFQADLGHLPTQTHDQLGCSQQSPGH